MDDKIFIREQEEPSEGNRSRMVILMILALVVVAVGASYFLFFNGNDDADTDSTTTTESLPVVDTDSDDLNTEEEVEEPVEEDVESADPETEPEELDNVDEEDFAAPSDETKLNLYFPKADGTFGPSLRDKPDNATTYVLTEILRGPNSDEQAAGYTKTWAFSGSSQCGGSTFKYEVSGSTLKLTMCKDFTGSDIEKYKKALNLSISELGLVSSVQVLDASGNTL